MGSSHGPRPRVAAHALAVGCLAGVVLLSAAARGPGHQSAPAASDAALRASSLLQGRLPVVAERRYRITGKVRLLLFWVGRDNVGGARLRWRRGDGAAGYDLLIGSDPARAPRRTNRWGFIMEEAGAGAAHVLGVMKKGQEDTLDEAKSNLAAEAADGVTFDMVRATIDDAESVAHLTTANVGRDYSYYELGALLERLVAAPPAPAVRRVALPTGGRKGLLLGVADLLHDGVETVRRTSKAPGRKSLPYVYYRKQYDLTRVDSSVERQASYGGVTYPRVLRSDFEIRARGETWTERFTIASGVDGPAADVPVFVSYQPRWWFKIELVLDEQQTF